MTYETPGIHHVTAIAGDPQQNLAFYTQVLGLRFVKKTVNHDDTHTYHLYYGDDAGHPGTNITFFPWPNGRQGQIGTGQAQTTAYLIPEDAVEYWTDRFDEHDVEFDEPTTRFDETVISFRDPDGLALELVAHPKTPEGSPWEHESIPTEYAIRGFHGVTLALEGYEHTASLLEEAMGIEFARDEDDRRFRYQSDGDLGFTIDLLCQPSRNRGQTGVGTVHHVAFRARSDEEQEAWRDALIDRGLDVTPVIDRKYFHSIYFREPGGVLFEIATEEPGFTVDEAYEELGTTLTLPAWLEDNREEIETYLPELDVPTVALTETDD
jgi:glyoxalase family protein